MNAASEMGSMTRSGRRVEQVARQFLLDRYP